MDFYKQDCRALEKENPNPVRDVELCNTNLIENIAIFSISQWE